MARAAPAGRVPQESDIDEIFDLRRLLEVEAVGLAVRRASWEDVERLRVIADDGRTAAEREDRPAAQDTNGRFHMELASLARHALLISFVEILDRKVHWLFRNVRLERFAEHDAIIEALDKRDVDAARTAAREHIDLTQAHLKELWGKAEVPTKTRGA